MKEVIRGLAAGLVGAVVALAVVVGQPALAGVQEKIAAKNSVTSKSIRDGTIKPKDLNSNIKASLAKANSALQSVPNNSVGSAKVIDGSLRVADLAASSGAVSLDFPNMLVGGACVASGAIETGRTVTGDFILVREPAGIAGNIQFYGREDQVSPTAINVVACNNGNSAFDPPTASYTWAVLAH